MALRAPLNSQKGLFLPKSCVETTLLMVQLGIMTDKCEQSMFRTKNFSECHRSLRSSAAARYPPPEPGAALQTSSARKPPAPATASALILSATITVRLLPLPKTP